MALASLIRDLRMPKVTRLQTSAVGHSQSLGVAERGNQALAEQIRCLKLDLEKMTKMSLDVRAAAWPWLVRRAAWILTRFVVRCNGKTAWETMHDRSYRGELARFGEIVWARRPYATVADKKLEGRWLSGVWLGKTEMSDEHLIADEKRTWRARAVRRKPEEDKFDDKILQTFKGAPWDMEANAGCEIPYENVPKEEPTASGGAGSPQEVGGWVGGWVRGGDSGLTRSGPLSSLAGHGPYLRAMGHSCGPRARRRHCCVVPQPLQTKTAHNMVAEPLTGGSAGFGSSRLSLHAIA